MPAKLTTPTTLSAEEMERFHRDGYVVVRGAFPRDDALAMQDEWWAELEEAHGIRRDDRSTWRPIRGDLKRAKHSPVQGKILCPCVHGVIDDLLGSSAWQPPADWGRAIATFPSLGAWDVPTGLWHWDSPCAWHNDKMKSLFVVSFIGSVAARAGGTLLLSGSPRLLQQQEATLDQTQRDSAAAARRELFYRLHPWLMSLTGIGPSPSNRTASFMRAETEVGGIALRVVELTGEPGDMVFCHPLIVHCASPNCGTQPRFMRIKMVMTDEGQRLLRGKPASEVEAFARARDRARAGRRDRRRARQGDY